MFIQHISYIVILILGIASSILFVWLFVKNIRHTDSRVGILLVVSCLIWITARSIHLLSSSILVKTLMDKVEYIGIAAVPILYILIVLQNTGYKKWITLKNKALLSIVPFLTVVFMLIL